MEENYSFISADGTRQEIKLDVTAYKAAAESGLSLAQWLEHKYPSHPDHGSTFSQMLQSAGMYVKSDRETGIHAPSMKAVLEGGAKIMAAGALVRNDGSDRHGISGRLLFPQVILELVAANLTENKDDFLAGYDSIVGLDTSVTSARVDQPTIDVTAPEGSRSQPISQLAEPATMVSITLSEKSFAIPTKSIGLLISDQALQATTLDLVGLTMSAQARGERIYMVEEQLGAMINGDADWGETALSSITAQSLDAGVTAASTISQKAWIHYLRDDYRKMTIDAILCDIDTALAIEGRANKPTVNTDDPNSPRIDALFSIENMALPRPRVILMDTAFIGADTIVGLDSRYAIRRVTNVSASYEAIEQWVMRRATAFRVDYGEMSKKLYTEAWKKMTLTVA